MKNNNNNSTKFFCYFQILWYLLSDFCFFTRFFYCIAIVFFWFSTLPCLLRDSLAFAQALLFLEYFSFVAFFAKFSYFSWFFYFLSTKSLIMYLQNSLGASRFFIFSRKFCFNFWDLLAFTRFFCFCQDCCVSIIFLVCS